MSKIAEIEVARDRLCEKVDAIWEVIDILSVDEYMAEENEMFIATLKGISDGLGYAEMVLRDVSEGLFK